MCLELTKGLLELGILQGELEQLLKDNACKAYFIHGLGHWLGLDVHDVGAYKVAGEERPFAPGMILTIEPGLYIPQGRLVIRSGGAWLYGLKMICWSQHKGTTT